MEPERIFMQNVMRVLRKNAQYACPEQERARAKCQGVRNDCYYQCDNGRRSYVQFDDWRNFMVYWKRDLQYKETIKKNLSNSQWKKLRDGIFGNFFRLQSVKFCGKLIHCILLSEIVNNDPDSMTFKVFDREIKFTRDAFHVITGLKCYSSLDIKGLHEKENRLSKVYFTGKDRIELGDLFSFISSHPHGTSSSFVGSNDDAVKLATVYFVESVLMGKRKNRNVSEQIMKIIDDDVLCSSFNWGSLSNDTLLKSLKSCLKPNENEIEKEKDKDKDKDSYTRLGFPFAFCVWIMELYKLIEVSPFIPVEEEDTEPLSVEEPISQYQSSRPSSTQFDEPILKEFVRRLSESFKKDLQAEVTRINQKIDVAEKKIENEIMKKIDVYDSIYSEPYEAGMNHMEMTDCGAFLIKYVELLMIGKDVEKFKPEDIKDFRKELAANLWAHGE
ncbi:PREDICTED: uncharacterized protein LOC109233614 [Nicotiana attenuata]|uniref:uncharacterized protein LOC109233614 n=1 Tax=Nicotiana attenuata TaxID=49451 RepID=UPI000904A6ED|nr:PREDICTED: uncharacterized protein LOC109233614 [Nicotiana attenuata]